MPGLEGNIQALILDLDGTAFDTEGPSRAILEAEAKARGVELGETLLSSLLGRSPADARDLLVQVLGSDIPVNDLIDSWGRRTLELLESEGFRSKAGLDELLDYLEQEGIKKAIGSSSEHRWVAGVLAGRAQRFDAVVHGECVARSKPEPDVFEEAARRLQKDPGSCLVVEDSEAGVIAAKRAGMQCVFVPDLIPPSEAVKKLSDGIVSSLAGVLALVREARENSGNPGARPSLD